MVSWGKKRGKWREGERRDSNSIGATAERGGRGSGERARRITIVSDDLGICG